jgi:hypothetical protein
MRDRLLCALARVRPTGVRWLVTGALRVGKGSWERSEGLCCVCAQRAPTVEGLPGTQNWDLLVSISPLRLQSIYPAHRLCYEGQVPC